VEQLYQAMADTRRQDIAIIGSGIAGLSCAWLLSQRHQVTVYEAGPYVGGHSCTVDVSLWPNQRIPVDMGFIVYNEPTYPNLTALFRHLEVATQPSCMSLGISVDEGRLEYGGHDLAALFAQPRNLVRPRFWSMLRQLLRLHKLAGPDLPDDVSLGEWLDRHEFPASFRDDHLLPMAAAIWSCAPGTALQQPANAFFRFCDNHGLLRLRDRPDWRTVTGGAREYVAKLTAGFTDRIRVDCPVGAVRREGGRVALQLPEGSVALHDQVVIATHGDQARALLADADAAERAVLGAFRCAPNLAVLHGDASLMPKRRAAWSSWNYLARTGADFAPPCVTYWMNRLQSIPGLDLFVTLNPVRMPEPGLIYAQQRFEHPVFDAASRRAQLDIWHLQGARRTWFCGAYLGAGFHEDGVQAGLAVAELLGGVRRPWRVAAESGRLRLPAPAPALAAAA
jgi:predicted NAD/FAD-binding protein